MPAPRVRGVASFVLVSAVSLVVYLRKPDPKAYSPAYDPEIRETPIRKPRSAAFEAFEAYAFDPKARHRTTALLVARNGEILFESYARGLRADRPQRLYSLSKIATSVLTGHLVKRGILSLDDLVTDSVPMLPQPWHQKLRVRDLLNMSSGLEYFRVDEANVPGLGVFARNHVPRLLSGHERTATLAVPIAAPGTRFNYSLIDNNLLGLVLERALEKVGGPGYVRTLFDRLRIRKSRLDLVREKTSFTADFSPDLRHLLALLNPDESYVLRDHVRFWSTPRDLLTLASLFLNDGVAAGEAYLPPDWSAVSWTVAESQRKLKVDPGGYNGHSYGAYWWLNRPLPIRPQRPYPFLPESLALIKGLGGQTLAVVPDEKLILIRFGDDPPDALIDRAKLIALLRTALEARP